jgi:hypothetical protein
MAKSSSASAAADVFDAPPPPDSLAYAAYLDAPVRLSEGARLRGVSYHTLLREGLAGCFEFVLLTDHMRGIRRRDALRLNLRGRGGRRKAGGKTAP